MSHHAGKQNSVKLTALHISNVIPAGRKAFGHFGTEIKPCPSEPGIFMASMKCPNRIDVDMNANEKKCSRGSAMLKFPACRYATLPPCAIC
jgi:hypothetical protein